MAYRTNTPATQAMLRAMMGVKGAINPMSYEQDLAKDPSYVLGQNLMRGTGNPKGTTSGAVRDAGERIIGSFLSNWQKKKYGELEDQAGKQWKDIVSGEGGLTGMQERASAFGDALNPKVAQQLGQMQLAESIEAPEREFQREQWEYQKGKTERELQLQERRLQEDAAHRKAQLGMQQAALAGTWQTTPDGRGMMNSRTGEIRALPEGYGPKQDPKMQYLENYAAAMAVPEEQRTPEQQKALFAGQALFGKGGYGSGQDRAMVQANAAQLKKDQDAMESTLNVMGQLDTALGNLGGGVSTGPLFGLEKTARQVGNVFGIGDPETVKKMESLESSLEYIRLNLSEFMKGAISEKEQEIMKRAAGSSSLTPEGLKEVLETAKGIQERKYRDLEGRREWYEEHGTFSGYKPSRLNRGASSGAKAQPSAPELPAGFQVLP